MQVYFTVNVGRKYEDSGWSPLATGFTVLPICVLPLLQSERGRKKFQMKMNQFDSQRDECSM